jgi:hypothetical protein
MELHGERLVLTSVTIEEAAVLLPAFNGDEQFNQWSGHASDLTLDQVQADMLGTLNQPGGVVWRLADQTEALVGVAKTALLPSPGSICWSFDAHFRGAAMVRKLLPCWKPISFLLLRSGR